VGAHPLNALNDAGRRATGRIYEFAVTVGFSARKSVDIAPERNKQSVRLLLLEHPHQQLHDAGIVRRSADDGGASRLLNTICQAFQPALDPGCAGRGGLVSRGGNLNNGHAIKTNRCFAGGLAVCD
jgi:hypothetical protein